MRSWTACWNFLRIFLSLTAFLFGGVISVCCQSFDASSLDIDYNSKITYHPAPNLAPSFLVAGRDTVAQDTVAQDINGKFPDPNSVMYKSMIIPGWGQIVNKQIWKVPIIYALLGGLTWYSIDLTKKYHDYRAAYYNLNKQTPNDMRFGPTPDYIPESASLPELKAIRNTYHNRRDMVYIGIALAYGLNILDSYVFAHMRTFDVSKDLSMRPSIKPDVLASISPGITLSFELFTNN